MEEVFPVPVVELIVGQHGGDPWWFSLERLCVGRALRTPHPTFRCRESPPSPSRGEGKKNTGPSGHSSIPQREKGSLAPALQKEPPSPLEGEGLGMRGALNLRGPWRYAQSRQTYLTSVNSSMPRRAPSRPRPDCLVPPNGI